MKKLFSDSSGCQMVTLNPRLISLKGYSIGRTGRAHPCGTFMRYEFVLFVAAGAQGLRFDDVLIQPGLLGLEVGEQGHLYLAVREIGPLVLMAALDRKGTIECDEASANHAKKPSWRLHPLWPIAVALVIVFLGLLRSN